MTSSTTSFGSKASRSSVFRRFSFLSLTREEESKSGRIAQQAYLYTLAFTLTWIFPTSMRIMRNPPSYGLLMCIAIFVPLQGFFNAVVYVRPRYLRNRKQHPEM